MRIVIFDDADTQHISDVFSGLPYLHAENGFDRVIAWLGKPLVLPTSTEPSAAHLVHPAQRSNLPQRQPFFGRKRFLEKIAEAISPASKSWGVLIYARGGLGKTSLAVEAAWNTSPGLFQRIIFLSARQQVFDDDGPRPAVQPLSDWLDLLNHCAKQLGQPDIMKAPVEERSGLILAAVAAQPTLLILDNLETLDESDRKAVLNFLEALPSHCKAILTCRKAFGNSRQMLPLERLDEADALELLDDLLGPVPVQDSEQREKRLKLHKETQGNPLLLRWTAGQIGNPRSPCKTLDDAIEHLRSCPKDQNDPLEFIFGDLLAQFTPEELRVVAILSYPEEPISLAAIAEINGLDESATRQTLNVLTKQSIVVSHESDQYFDLIPMVVVFIKRARRAAVLQAGENLVSRAFDLIQKNGGIKYDAFSVIEKNWSSISPALPFFIEVDMDRLQKAQALLYRFFHTSGRWDEWFWFESQLEEKAVKEGAFFTAGWAAFSIGWCSILRGQYKEALAAAERIDNYLPNVTHYPEGPPNELKAAVTRLRGHVARLKGDYERAIKSYGEARNIDEADFHNPSVSENQRNTSQHNVALNLNWLAITKRRKGDLAGAKRDAKEALSISNSVIAEDGTKGYREGRATAMSVLIGVAVDQKKWGHAIQLAKETLELAEGVRREELIAQVCHEYARALKGTGQTSEAKSHAERAVKIFTRLRSPELATAKGTLAECEVAWVPA